MLSLPSTLRIFLAREAVDFRKAHDGLIAIVRDHLGGDPFAGHLFTFFNRRRDRIKILVWDRNGFWLFYKRLECGTFRFPASVHRSSQIEITRAELAMILEGIDLEKGKIRKHFAEEMRINDRRSDGTPGHFLL